MVCFQYLLKYCISTLDKLKTIIDVKKYIQDLHLEYYFLNLALAFSTSAIASALLLIASLIKPIHKSCNFTS